MTASLEKEAEQLDSISAENRNVMQINGVHVINQFVVGQQTVDEVDSFTLIADIPSRQRPRLLHPTIYSFLLSDCLLLDVGCAFHLAGTCTWNHLPVDVTSAPSLLTFRKSLKLHLFRLS